MKALSRTFTAIVLVAITTVTISSLKQRAFAYNKKEKIIGDPDPPRKYREFNKPPPDGERDFRDALTTLKNKGGDCQIYLLRGPNDKEIFNYCDQIQLSLKTDKVIKYQAANETWAEGSAANDPNVTYRVASYNQDDVDAVIKTLK
jgi:hypothetical protein